MTFGTAAILLLLLGIISSVMTGVFVMMLSEVFRSMIPAIIIPIILVTFAAIGTSTSSINVFLGYHPVIKIGLDVLREHNLITLGSIVINPFCACFVIYVLFTLICIPICRWSSDVCEESVTFMPLTISKNTFKKIER